ncbi:MAG: tRNA (adenosine(37)-N6)-threonylcarbamoyltransferase complex transferase subunit TsaD [Thiotrichales bacterium]|nr:MAG: tRNA (adenosine(37)-N6)-threonylcarbamoyltransferase complex transferase subunit TsaD [Thiotrichales bacterium]
MLVLGIESSCDDTGVAIYDTTQGLIANELHSQTALHAEYGGVVPELSSRDHIKHILPLCKTALAKAKSTLADIDYIAYTAGPGLMGSLMVGAGFAVSLAFSLDIPAIPINHLEGHILAIMLEQTVDMPFIALLVSGGHTMLVKVTAVGDYEILGQTLDDAAGEAFDKTAKLLGLPYPGGAALAALAEKGEIGKFTFPVPMLKHANLDFSFSGLKTFSLNTVKNCKDNLSIETKQNIAIAFEEAAVKTLTVKCKRACDRTGIKRLVMAGGVACNKRLRNSLGALAKKQSLTLHYPSAKFCTDNAAMIAMAGTLRVQNDLLHQDNNDTINLDPCWKL